jgi:hypothetical protein
MKASQLVQGTRAIRRVPLPRLNDGRQLFQPLEGSGESAAVTSSMEVGVRALTGTEQLIILERAAEDARKRKAESKPGDQVYDLLVAAHTLAVACVDPDDPASPPFFDGGAPQILESEWLGTDGIAALCEQQALWQDACAPQAMTLTDDELKLAIVELASPGGSDFFLRLRPGLRLMLARFMAGLLLSSPGDKSPSGGSSDAATPSEKTTPPNDTSKSTGIDGEA